MTNRKIPAGFIVRNWLTVLILFQQKCNTNISKWNPLGTRFDLVLVFSK